MRESVMYIQCGLQYSGQPSPVVLLIGKSVLMAVNGTTGQETILARGPISVSPTAVFVLSSSGSSEGLYICEKGKARLSKDSSQPPGYPSRRER